MSVELRDRVVNELSGVLSSAQFRVMKELAWKTNTDTNECYPRISTLCKEMGVKDRFTVQDTIAQLESMGYLFVERVPGRNSKYVVHITPLLPENRSKVSTPHPTGGCGIDPTGGCGVLPTPIKELDRKAKSKSPTIVSPVATNQCDTGGVSEVGSMNGEGVPNPVPCTESETTMNDSIDYHRNQFGVYTPYSLHFLKDWHRKPTISPLSPKSPLDPAYADAFSDSGETYRHLNSALCLELLAQNPGWADKLDNMMRYEERGPRDTSAQGVLAWKMRNVRDWWHDTATAPTYYSHGRYEAYRTMSQLPAKCRTAVDKALDTVKRTISKGDLFTPIYAKLTAGDNLRVSVEDTLTSDPRSDYFACRPEVLIGWDNTIYELTERVKRSVVYCLGVTSPTLVNPSGVSIAERVTERGEVYYNSDKNRWEFTPAPSDDNANDLDDEVVALFREAAQEWCDAFWCEWKAALPGLLREVWRLANESHFFAMRSDKEWTETLRPAYKKAEGIMLASLDNGQFDELINAPRWHNAPVRYQYFGGYYEAGLPITPAEAKAMQAKLYGGVGK